MDKLLIRGGQRLSGTVEIRGAKNAALPAFAASLLSDKPLTLRNLPDVVDVKTMQTLLEGYGVAFTERGTDALMLDAAQAGPREASYDTVRKMRATILVLGPLVARFGEARVSLPGGCAIGARPVDLHIKALEALGAEIDVAGGYIEAKAPRGLSGARIVFPFSSVGATETALLAASRAKGETEIVNAAKEPEALDLARCLSAMGVRIRASAATVCWFKVRRTCRPRRMRSSPTASRQAPMRSPPRSPAASRTGRRRAARASRGRRRGAGGGRRPAC
ncbi:UDP-N-acetylglucosamine 1-carboxyvinyltransferase [Bosea thiooxidans]